MKSNVFKLRKSSRRTLDSKQSRRNEPIIIGKINEVYAF